VTTLATLIDARKALEQRRCERAASLAMEEEAA
jgi:hypothetical protein